MRPGGAHPLQSPESPAAAVAGVALRRSLVEGAREGRHVPVELSAVDGQGQLPLARALKGDPHTHRPSTDERWTSFDALPPVLPMTAPGSSCENTLEKRGEGGFNFFHSASKSRLNACTSRDPCS